MIKSGIYAIVNIINFKYYIGSTFNFKKRWFNHISELNRNVHANKYLQHAYNKYTRENFIFVVLEYTDNLIERENFWIANLDCSNRYIGYNICLVAESVLGIKRSTETKLKLSLLKKGKSLSIETKIKISNSLKGRKNPHNGIKQTEEANAKRAKAMIGFRHSEESLAKMRAKRHTEESLNKMRGLKRSEETRQRMSKSFKGKLVSEETKFKISIAQKARWCKLKANVDATNG